MSTSRRAYIDWLRGIAVLIMIEWHVVDAWTSDAERTRPVFGSLAFLGGWAAPLFLFLAGLAVPFAAASHVRKGRSPQQASRALQIRGWQVVGIAHLFRLQSYLLNPDARFDSIFKPDILNILGLGLVVAAWCWGQAATRRQRCLWLMAPAAALVVLTPLVRGWWWPTLLWPRLEAYLRPNGWGQFAIFPWLAFVLVGAVAGLWIAEARTAEADRRFHARLALAALATIGVGLVGMWIPSPFEQSSFWTTSVSYFIIRTGVMVLALAASWWLLARPWGSVTGAFHRAVVLFGQTSLFVYWVHVELAYGILSAVWKRSLLLPETAAAYLVFTLALHQAARWWAWRTAAGPWVPAHLKEKGRTGTMPVRPSSGRR